MQGQRDIQELIGFLFNQINELKQIIEELKSENEELKSKLSNYQTKKNSNNSSKPPSSDFSNLKKTKSLKKSSGKKVGGQPGHKGSSMKMVSNPDFTEGYHPSYCNSCGNDLSNVGPTLFGKRQWQINFTYFKIIGWGWYFLSTIMDDYSRYIIFRELCKNMESADAMRSVEDALQKTGLQENNRPRLLSDNGICYVSNEFNTFISTVHENYHYQ